MHEDPPQNKDTEPGLWYNDRSTAHQYTAAVLYLHLATYYQFRTADLERLAYQEPSHKDADWRFRRPSRGPALIMPRNLGRMVTFLRIPGTHQLDPRWSCVDPEFAFGLPECSDRRLTQSFMRTLDDERKSKIIQHEYEDTDPDVLTPDPYSYQT